MDASEFRQREKMILIFRFKSLFDGNLPSLSLPPGYQPCTKYKSTALF